MPLISSKVELLFFIDCLELSQIHSLVNSNLAEPILTTKQAPGIGVCSDSIHLGCAESSCPRETKFCIGSRSLPRQIRFQDKFRPCRDKSQANTS